MNTVGIVGGIAPESTIEYYRLIISSYLERKGDGNYPRIIINSINMKEMLDLIGENRLDELAKYLIKEIDKLAAAGADFALLASNMPHIIFGEIEQSSPLPLISIVEVTCERSRKMGLQRVGLFGTRFTMQGLFYDEIFSEHNIDVITPDEREQDYIHARYMNELVRGIILDETKSGLIDIVTRLRRDQDIEGLILGGTELPLILKDSDDIGIPLLNTTSIHVESILRRLV